MILLILISIIFSFLIGLLILPIRLILNSEREKYIVEIPIYFSAQLVPENQLFFLKLRVLFIPVKINPFQHAKTKTKRPKNKKKSERSSNFRDIATKAIKSVTVKKANADIDTGNFPLNAQLIPLVQFINNKNIHLNINFENKNRIDIEIFTRLYKLIWIGLTNKLITSKK